MKKNRFEKIDNGDDDTLKIEDPSVPVASGNDEDFPTYEELDKLVLEESGYDLNSSKAQEILENVIAESTDEKIFTIRDKENSDDKLKQSFNIEGAAYEIIKNPAFDEYWRTRILDKLDTERDKLLLEQITDSFIGDKVYFKLDELSKLEVFYYIDFFREIVSETKNEETMSLVDLEDDLFDDMPNVVRLY